MNTLLRSSLLRLAVLLCCLTGSLTAQTTSFTYQGRLTDGGASASGPYDLQFKLYDAATAGNQIGATLLRDEVNVTNGVFSTTLDFGATAFPGAARWLEISVRLGASTGAYTTLAPRQPVHSTPYAIRALSAETVTGPVPASQITGTLPPSALPAGGAYINNSTTQQASSNFHISGNGTAAGTLSSNVVNAATQYNLNGARVLGGNSGNFTLFAGVRAGESNTSNGNGNAFFGHYAGQANTTGTYNSFFGNNAGRDGLTGANNAFFGYSAGSQTNGANNSFFGTGVGVGNTTGEENAYFGFNTGAASNGFGNSFFGTRAGENASLTSYNSFFGRRAGLNTSNASYNAFFGAEAGVANTNGRNNAFFGAYAGAVNTTGSYNTFVGYSAAPLNDTGSYNTFVGYAGGFTNTGGSNNTLLGANTNLSQGGLSFATAIGAGTIVPDSNTVAIGRNVDKVSITGTLVVSKLFTPEINANIPACLRATITANTYVLGRCPSSRRYKTNIASLPTGLNLISQLRPVTFDWEKSGEHDLGFIAEEVAEVEPLLTYRNEKGETEGVKYQLVSAVLVNAVKEQQTQIEQQQKQLKVQQEQFKQQQAELAQLKQLLCAAQPQAAACQPKP